MRQPLVAPARARRDSSDDLTALANSDANATALRAAAAELERLRSELDQERQRNAGPAFPPPTVPGPAAPPAVVEADQTEAELVAGYRRGRRLAGKLGWILGALTAVGAIGGAGVIGGQVALNPRPAKEANLTDAVKGLRAVERWRDSVQPWLRGDYSDRATKERLLLDWACQQGFRAPKIDCAALRDQAREDARRGETADWPDPRKPPPLPDPEAP